MALGNTVKQITHLKDISPVLKNFVFFRIINILFCCKNQKNMLQEEIKDGTFEAYLLPEETSSSFLLIESFKMTYARSYVWFLNFLDFLWHVLPKLVKQMRPVPSQ